MTQTATLLDAGRPNFTAVVFDFDGTLVDSLPGITASLQAAANHCDLERMLPDLSAFIGPPLPAMLQKIWPDLSAAQLADLIAAYRVHYDLGGCLETRPFPGAGELLAGAYRAGRTLFVLTNKPHRPTRRILEHHGWDGYFTATCSPDTPGLEFSGKPEGGRRLLERYGLDPSRTLLVGDGHDDYRTAEICGFAFAAAAFGYGSAVGSGEATWQVIHRLSDLAPWLLLTDTAQRPL